jgi:hypothetical protein
LFSTSNQISEVLKLISDRVKIANQSSGNPIKIKKNSIEAMSLLLFCLDVMRSNKIKLQISSPKGPVGPGSPGSMLFKGNQKGSIIIREGNDENNFNLDKLQSSLNELSMQAMPTLQNIGEKHYSPKLKKSLKENEEIKNGLRSSFEDQKGSKKNSMNFYYKYAMGDPQSFSDEPIKKILKEKDEFKRNIYNTSYIVQKLNESINRRERAQNDKSIEAEDGEFRIRKGVTSLLNNIYRCIYFLHTFSSWKAYSFLCQIIKVY